MGTFQEVRRVKTVLAKGPKEIVKKKRGGEHLGGSVS